MNLQTITLGGGCFWCTEAVFDRVRGITDVESGYTNGHTVNPTYEQICQGDTGHAEVVRLTFDADEISLEEILEIFFHTHDPTTLNRQGNDVGTQYRSGIYYDRPEHGSGQRHDPPDVARQAVQRPHHHRSGAAFQLQHGRGVSPGLLCEPPSRRVLRIRGGPQGREIPQDVCALSERLRPGWFLR